MRKKEEPIRIEREKTHTEIAAGALADEILKHYQKDGIQNDGSDFLCAAKALQVLMNIERESQFIAVDSIFSSK